MTPRRRSQDRRRRVLTTHQTTDSQAPTAASRRAAEKLREARRPTEAYGSGVKRRLRGRWYSLVPIRRRTLVSIASVIGIVVMMLCWAHYASVAWPSIAYHDQIARPLRLDRPDGFGRWMICSLLMACSGATLLIYQLRRYRNDDYQGHYRLWRIVLFVTLGASVNSLVGLVDWCGAIMDAAFGQRVAISGNDWLRIGLTIGGAVLAIRLIAEVRKSRWAMVTMIAAWAAIAIPTAAKWNVLQVDTLGKWTLVTSAPLVGVALLFLSFGGYLRMLYREVRRIEDSETLRERFQDFRIRVFSGGDDRITETETSEDASEEDSEELSDDSSGSDVTERRGRWWGSRRSRKDKDAKRASSKRSTEPDDADDEFDDSDAYEQDDHEESAYDDQSDDDSDAVGDTDETDERSTQRRPKRRWFGLRRAKTEATGTGESDDPDSDSEQDEINETAQAEQPDDDASEPPKRKKKRRFSLRLAPANRAQTADTESADDADSQDDTSPHDSDDQVDAEAESDSPPKKRGGLFGWRKKTQAVEEATDEAEHDQDAGTPEKANQAPAASDESDLVEIDGELIDPAEIDWENMNKSERRRMRKLLKRSGRAA